MLNFAPNERNINVLYKFQNSWGL